MHSFAHWWTCDQMVANSERVVTPRNGRGRYPRFASRFAHPSIRGFHDDVRSKPSCFGPLQSSRSPLAARDGWCRRQQSQVAPCWYVLSSTECQGSRSLPVSRQSQSRLPAPIRLARENQDILEVRVGGSLGTRISQSTLSAVACAGAPGRAQARASRSWSDLKKDFSESVVLVDIRRTVQRRSEGSSSTTRITRLLQRARTTLPEPISSRPSDMLGSLQDSARIYERRSEIEFFSGRMRSMGKAVLNSYDGT